MAIHISRIPRGGQLYQPPPPNNILQRYVWCPLSKQRYAWLSPPPTFTVCLPHSSAVPTLRGMALPAALGIKSRHADLPLLRRSGQSDRGEHDLCASREHVERGRDLVAEPRSCHVERARESRYYGSSVPVCVRGTPGSHSPWFGSWRTSREFGLQFACTDCEVVKGAKEGTVKWTTTMPSQPGRYYHFNDAISKRVAVRIVYRNRNNELVFDLGEIECPVKHYTGLWKKA